MVSLTSFLAKFVALEVQRLLDMKRIFLGITLVALTAMLTATNVIEARLKVEESPVKWMTFEQAVEKSKTEKRKIFIDVYTDWCGWCKVMDKKTFSDPKVAKILNENFYPVKFDAEQTAEIVFHGTTFKNVGSGSKGTHQLAAALLNNQLSYPTVVFLDEEFRMIQPLPGFKEASEFHMIAQFIGEDHYKTSKWTEWQATYKSPF
jgi:thioredoxin-related protein